ncbi:MAG TPA: FxsA family protein [Microlunatus sp.]
MRTRSGWLTPLILVLLVTIPILEVWLLIQVGQQIGILPTLAILIVEALLGGWLMRHEGSRAWVALNEAFNSGRMPTGELADAALVLVGGVLLMLPGFVTDIVGFFFLLPFTRPLARKLLTFLVARRLTRLGVVGGLSVRRDGTVIEGETVEGETVPDQPPGPGRPGPIVIAGEIEEGPDEGGESRARRTG